MQGFEHPPNERSQQHACAYPSVHRSIAHNSITKLMKFLKGAAIARATTAKGQELQKVSSVITQLSRFPATGQLGNYSAQKKHYYSVQK
jgi:hypothetical protein